MATWWAVARAATPVGGGWSVWSDHCSPPTLCNRWLCKHTFANTNQARGALIWTRTYFLTSWWQGLHASTVWVPETSVVTGGGAVQDITHVSVSWHPRATAIRSVSLCAGAAFGVVWPKADRWSDPPVELEMITIHHSSLWHFRWTHYLLLCRRPTIRCLSWPRPA